MLRIVFIKATKLDFLIADNNEFSYFHSTNKKPESDVDVSGPCSN